MRSLNFGRGQSVDSVPTEGYPDLVLIDPEGGSDAEPTPIPGYAVPFLLPQPRLGCRCAPSN